MENIAGMLPLILMVVVIYFFFIRPQAKKQKSQSNFVNEIKKGDEIVTGSGIIGKITKIENDIISIQVDQKTFIKVLRSAISKELTDGLKSAK